MKNLQIACGQCSAAIALPLEPHVVVACPHCRARVEVHAFPAVARGQGEGKQAETIVDDSGSCFYHADKKAEAACDQCGRFLCALCDVPLEGRRLCPACIESGLEKNTVVPYRDGIICYDDVAVGIAFSAVFVYFASFILAPAAIFLSIWWWKRPLTFFRRNRGRFLWAIALALIILSFWVVVLFDIFTTLARMPAEPPAAANQAAVLDD